MNIFVTTYYRETLVTIYQNIFDFIEIRLVLKQLKNSKALGDEENAIDLRSRAQRYEDEKSLK